MDDDAPHRQPWPRVLARVLGYLVLAVVLYLLGLGPAYYFLGERSAGAERVMEALCQPLSGLDERTPFTGLLMYYVDWWGGLPGGPDDRVKSGRSYHIKE